MKYNIGDKVKIRRDLIVGKRYGDNTYVKLMEDCAKDHDYVLTIEDYSWDDTQYRMVETTAGYNWTEEMIERLANMKYKVGDKVKIRKDLIIHKPYGTKTFVSTMKRMCDEYDYILTIKKVREDGVYIMEEDVSATGVEFCWTDEMIKGLAEKKEIKDMKYKVGDKVVVRKDLMVGERYEGLTYYTNMKKETEENGDNGVIITKAWIDSYGRRLYKFEECAFTYSEAMIEGLVEDKELNKFEAFLREVVNENSPEYCNEWRYVCHLTDGEDVDENVAYLVEFYKTFEPKPKPQPKKLTMAELRDIVGEEFEIVD